MPPKQSNTTPAATAINALISDIDNPKRFSFDEHVKYFSLYFIEKIQNAGNELSRAENAIKKYADYLASEINRKELINVVTTQRCAYLIQAVSKLLGLRLSISLKNPLSNLISALGQHWLQSNSGELRYQVQYFYHLIKVLKENTPFFTQFFTTSDVETLVGKKINVLLLELISSVNTQDIANTFLALGYLAQCSSHFQQSNMAAEYTTYCTTLLKKHSLECYNSISIIQIPISVYRIFYACNAWALNSSDLPALEAQLKKQKPIPNTLQTTFSKQLNQL